LEKATQNKMKTKWSLGLFCNTSSRESGDYYSSLWHTGTPVVVIGVTKELTHGSGLDRKPAYSSLQLFLQLQT